MESSASQAGRILTPLESSVETFSIDSPEELAADGRRFSLSIDASSEQAWLSVSGGIANHIEESYGPWPLTNPDVQRLLAQRFDETQQSGQER